MPFLINSLHIMQLGESTLVVCTCRVDWTNNHEKYKVNNLWESFEKFTWSRLVIKLARPQSERWGFISASSKILADLIFLWTTEGAQTSCRYLQKFSETSGVWITNIKKFMSNKAVIISEPTADLKALHIYASSFTFKSIHKHLGSWKHVKTYW